MKFRREACLIGSVSYAASAGAFCGNKIVEAGEECDCGYDDDECVDKCCYPRQVSELDKIKNETAKGCSRKIGTQCRYTVQSCSASEKSVMLGCLLDPL